MQNQPRRPYYKNEGFLQKLGLRIRELRVEKGMTQMDLAFKCNDIDYSQINRIELGKVNFTVSYLKMIADSLDVEVIALLTI